MDVREYIRIMRGRLEQLKANRSREVLTIAQDLTALIKLRIQSEGEDFQGQPFSPYTADYAKRRRKGGYQTDYVDFTVTGALMADIQPEVIAEDENSTVVEITARDPDDQLKLRGARGKRGNILIASSEELKMVRAAQIERIRKYLII